MRQFSWHDGCPTPLADLVLLRLNHYGYDGAIHDGELVVHADLADEVLAIFRSLFEQHFPIEKMRLIEVYEGSDDASMSDNNTSGFNCRFVKGKTGSFSKHSRGRAIDINPRTNPMVVPMVVPMDPPMVVPVDPPMVAPVDGGERVFPPSGAAFLNRSRPAPGMLRAHSRAVLAFKRRGWTWGGTWSSLKDYQHFEK